MWKYFCQWILIFKLHKIWSLNIAAHWWSLIKCNISVICIESCLYLLSEQTTQMTVNTECLTGSLQDSCNQANEIPLIQQSLPSTWASSAIHPPQGVFYRPTTPGGDQNLLTIKAQSPYEISTPFHCSRQVILPSLTLTLAKIPSNYHKESQIPSPQPLLVEQKTHFP